MKIRPIAFCLLLALLPVFAARGAITYSVLARLGASPDGAELNPLVQAADGNLYGTTASGGTSNDGTIFQLASTGTLTTLYSFTGGDDGAVPLGPLVLGSDGALYGTATSGGSASAGVYFKITTGGTFTPLHAFNGTSEGAAPELLVPGTGEHNFYGTSQNGGGGNQGGTVLQLTEAGAVNVLHAFTVEATDGGFVNPYIVQGSDGAFYGSTQEGGPGTFGTIFRITTAGSFSVIGSAASSSDKPFLQALGSDGNIYGINSGNHTVFNMTNAGLRTPFYTFTHGDDGFGAQTLIHGADGNFYGIASGGGAHGFGTFFELTAGGAFSVLHPFTSAENLVDTLIQAADQSFYATSTTGGRGFGGSVFHLTSDGTSTDIHDFSHGGKAPMAGLIQGLDGHLYGTTFLGGATGDGTVFAVSTAGDFLGSTSFDFATTGSAPSAPLVQDPGTGIFYGTATTGGANYSSALNLGGTLVSITATPASGNQLGVRNQLGFHPNIVGAAVVLLMKSQDNNQNTNILFTYFAYLGLVELDLPAGAYTPPPPKHAARAVQAATTGALFGVSERGGDNGQGTLYAVDPTAQLQTGLYSFGDQAGDGSNPEAAPVADAAGNLYGTTAFGGSGSSGTIYKLTPATSTTAARMTTLHTFTGLTADGASPGSNNLVVGKNGLIYGTAQSGGAHSNGGVVFSITPTGTFKLLHSFQARQSNGTDGSVPTAGLIQASDGNFYGTTLAGGTRGTGTVFSITPAGKVTILHSFGDGVTGDGAQPQAKLLQATDGNLYGATPNGGTRGAGVVFKIAAGLPIPKGTQSQTITLPEIANQTFGVAPLTLGATASSGLDVTYAVAGPAAVLGSTLTITGVGTVKVTASQSGNPTFAAAPPVSQSFTVAKGTQTITFPALADPAFSPSPLTLPNPPTASSGLPVTVKVLSGPATVVAGKLTLTGVGTVTLAANQTGNANVAAAAQVTISFLVNQGSQTIAPFATIPTHNKGDPAFAITLPKASSSLPVTVTVQSGPATISGTRVTVTGVGSVVLAADQPGNANYHAAPEITTSFEVDEEKQTIAPFAAIAAKNFGVAPFAIVPPRTSSGLPVAVNVFSGNATISNNVVTLTGDGPVVLAANQPGDAVFAAAAQVTTTFMVKGLFQTISAFATIPAHTFGDAPFGITPPAASSGLAVVVTVKSGPATISNNTVTLTGAGTVVLAADQPGDITRAPAKEVTTKFAVARSAQTLAAFSPIAAQPYSTTPLTINPPLASSGLPVTVKVKSGRARIAGHEVIFTGLGTVVLSASQAGNANYRPATTVTTSFTVSRGSQTIAAFATIPDQVFGAAAFVVPTPVATSGRPVTVSVLSGPATLSRGKLTLTGAGTVLLAANQAGNANVSAAPQVTTSFTVNKASQTLADFQPISAKVVGAAAFTVAAPAATSRLPVVLSVLSGPATIAGGKVKVSGVGTVVLAADQPGNANFNAAPEVTTSFAVN